ncbi:MAG: ATP-binding protein [Pseudomonadota bacterium]
MNHTAPASIPDSGLNYRLKPTFEAVRETLLRVTGDCSRAGLSSALTERIELVVAEALNNVVEHGQLCIDSGYIQLFVSQIDRTMLIKIRDTGAPMPGLVLPDGRPPQMSGPIEDLPEGGFGWFIIKSLADGLGYTRSDGWNELEIRISASNAAA